MRLAVMRKITLVGIVAAELAEGSNNPGKILSDAYNGEVEEISPKR